jgi:hypothetical protein
MSLVRFRKRIGMTGASAMPKPDEVEHESPSNSEHFFQERVSRRCSAHRVRSPGEVRELNKPGQSCDDLCTLLFAADLRKAIRWAPTETPRRPASVKPPPGAQLTSRVFLRLRQCGRRLGSLRKAMHCRVKNAAKFAQQASSARSQVFLPAVHEPVLEVAYARLDHRTASKPRGLVRWESQAHVARCSDARY